MTADLQKPIDVKAILFDVYGTLLISDAGEIGIHSKPADSADGVAALLNRYDIQRSPGQIAAALHQAIRSAHSVSKRSGEPCPEVDIVKIWASILDRADTRRIKRLAAEYELIVNPVCPMPGMEQLVAACGHVRLPMGIVSNAQFYTVWVLNLVLGKPLAACGFDPRLLFFSWQQGSAKPSAAMFDRAQTTLAARGIRPGSVLYLGNDLRNDIAPAQAVGFKTALFAGDRRSLRLRQTDRSCRHIDPDWVVTDLRQLIPTLRDHYL
jgi:putative hydrolase of the HAD superfamily